MAYNTVPLKKAKTKSNRMMVMGGQPSDRIADIDEKAKKTLNRSGFSHSQLDRSSVKSSLKRGGT